MLGEGEGELKEREEIGLDETERLELSLFEIVLVGEDVGEKELLVEEV